MSDFTMPPLPPGVGISMGNPAIIQILQNVLNDAKAGNITTIALVVVNKTGGVYPVMEGTQAGDVYVGASLLRKKILDAIDQPQQQQRIIPVRGNGMG